MATTTIAYYRLMRTVIEDDIIELDFNENQILEAVIKHLDGKAEAS